jgi:hypothetical protein
LHGRERFELVTFGAGARFAGLRWRHPLGV